MHSGEALRYRLTLACAYGGKIFALVLSCSYWFLLHFFCFSFFLRYFFSLNPFVSCFWFLSLLYFHRVFIVLVILALISLSYSILLLLYSFCLLLCFYFCGVLLVLAQSCFPTPFSFFFTLLASSSGFSFFILIFLYPLILLASSAVHFHTSLVSPAHSHLIFVARAPYVLCLYVPRAQESPPPSRGFPGFIVCVFLSFLNIPPLRLIFLFLSWVL